MDTTSTTHRSSILETLASNKVAANVIMLLMFLAGFWGLSKLNTQFFPTFELERASIRTPWISANPEDVETAITNPIEEAIRGVDNIDKITSSSASGVSAITVTFVEGTDMGEAVDELDQKIAEIKNLPSDAEKPTVRQITVYETVGQIAISSDKLDILELRQVAYQIEDQLLKAGIDKVSFSGLPELEMSIDASLEQLNTYGLSLNDIRNKINNYSLDAPAGTAAEGTSGVDIRALQQGRTELDFQNIPIITNRNQYIRLGDIANIKLKPLDGSSEIWEGNKRSITLKVQRLENSSTLKAAEILKKWEQETAPKLKEQVDITIFDKSWVLLEQRIGVLLENGLGGLILVVLILVLFMNVRIAFWIALGIPTSLLCTMGVYYLMGGSINMLSLFAFIMTLGVIVDDAIVVGEHAFTQFERGHAPLESAMNGAKRMFFPVLASSLTTIAAFLPLMLLSGTIGKFLVTIPIVAICVIIASLIESFLVLPGHLHHTFEKIKKKGKRLSKVRLYLDNKIDGFRENIFRPFIGGCLKHRLVVLVFSVCCFVLGINLVTSGRIGFVFFPAIEANRLDMQVTFVSGTPIETIRDYLKYADETLQRTDEELGGGLVETHLQQVGLSSGVGAASSNFGSIYVELIDGEKRSVRNYQFIEKWRSNLNKIPGISRLEIAAMRGGPGGKDISFQLSGDNLFALKASSLELMEVLGGLPGVNNVNDDLVYGKDQLVMQLTPTAQSLNISLSEISRQIRNAYSGAKVQIITDNKDDIDVTVRLPKKQRDQLNTLDSFQIKLTNGTLVPLANLVTWRSKKGFNVIRHYNTQASVNVFADVNTNEITLNELLPQLKTEALPRIASKYNIEWSLEGSAKRQAQTFGDMTTGLIIGVSLIYIILVWVFGSWGWPFVIIAIIPFGLFGAILGHWAMDIKLTILSMLGMFGLSGIVINDSIVLVTTYRHLKKASTNIFEALIETSCQRLRAVLLTSLTTIVGLTPLLFETNLQAQFLIPMATTIAFGLAVATLLVLILVPTLLSYYEQVHTWYVKRRNPSDDHPSHHLNV